MRGKSKRLVWAPRAEQDIASIRVYYVREASVEVAEQMLRGIHRAAKNILEHQLIGRNQSDIMPTLRSVISNPYLIFYRARPAGIQIARVLHQRRNMRRILSDTK